MRPVTLTPALAALFLAAALAATPVVSSPPVVASGSAANDYLGWSVARSGDTLFTGASNAAVGGNEDQGRAVVFVRDGDAWSEQQVLTAPDGAAYEYFGRAVALDGDTAVAGATRNGGNPGAAYVFVRSGGTWTLQQRLAATTAPGQDLFGTAVAVQGDTVVVGAAAESSTSPWSGGAYVFTRSGGVWTQQAHLTVPGAPQDLSAGISVAIDGDTVLVGSGFDFEDSTLAGSAYVYRRNGSNWILEAALTAEGTTVPDSFGYRVALDGDTAFVSAPLHPIGSTDYVGRTYVFTRTGATWTRTALLENPDGEVGSRFGNSIAIEGDLAVIGADLAVTNGGPNAAGAGFAYARSGGTWNLIGRLTADVPVEFALLGAGADIDGGEIVLGAPLDTVGGISRQGSFRIYVPPFGSGGGSGGPGTQAVVPSRVTAKVNAGNPAKSKLTVTGTLHTGFVDPDFTQPATFTVGGLTLNFPGLTAAANGKSFSYVGEGIKLKIKPGKKGSSRTTFKLVRTGDLTGLVSADGPLAMEYAGGGLDATGTVALAAGKYVKKQAGTALSDPPYYLVSLKAVLKGAGKDSLTMTAGFDSDGTVPAAAPQVSLEIGSLDVTVPAGGFVQRGNTWSFRGNESGITSVVIDYAKGTVKVTGSKLTLGSFAAGVVDLTVTLGLDADEGDMEVQAVSSGKQLKY